MDKKENAHADDMGALKSNKSDSVPYSESSTKQSKLQLKNLRAALYYAKRGWPVIPLHYPTNTGCSCRKKDCSSIGKHPRTIKGSKDATTNIEQIQKWWRNCPKAGIGILTGKKILPMNVLL